MSVIFFTYTISNKIRNRIRDTLINILTNDTIRNKMGANDHIYDTNK